MAKLEANFFEYDPEKFATLDLTSYSEAALKEMAYFLWIAYPEDLGLMEWRRVKLLPLLQIDTLSYGDSEED